MLKNKIKTLINLIENTEIDEKEVSSFWGAQKIKLSKNKSSQIKDKVLIDSVDSNVNIDPSVSTSPDIVNLEKNNKIEEIEENKNIENSNSLNSENEVKDDIDYYDMKAPLVGTFYSSPKPSDPPFINVGDKITKGQTICIIEAMKIFNDIESEINGTVHEICVENGNPVEFDQSIIKVSMD